MRRVFSLSLALSGLLLLLTTATAEDNADLDGSPPGPAVGSQGSCKQGQRCVQKHHCGNESASGVVVIDISSSDRNPCGNYLLQCCDEKDIIPVIPLNAEPRNMAHPVCGKRNLGGIYYRIMGAQDNETEYGEFPWMVAVMRHLIVVNQVVNAYLCGGSLIHPNVVLTAAHSVRHQFPNQLRIRAGVWDIQTLNEVYPYQDRQVVEIVAHPDYHKGALHNDIALVVLKRPVILNEAVQTVCLPPPNTRFDFMKCVVSGWGKDAFGKAGKFQAIQKKTDMPIVPHTKCQTALRSFRSQPGFILHGSFVCAGGEVGKGTCLGDGGSPLVCPVQGTEGESYQQVGIVSWGIGCGEKIPEMYADVSHFRNWIDREMRNRKLDTSSYTYDG